MRWPGGRAQGIGGQGGRGQGSGRADSKPARSIASAMASGKAADLERELTELHAK